MSNEARRPSNAEETNPDEGPTMTVAGAMPSGSEMGWKTAHPNPDATKPETMPRTNSEPMPGETDHDQRSDAAQSD